VRLLWVVAAVAVVGAGAPMTLSAQDSAAVAPDTPTADTTAPSAAPDSTAPSTVRSPRPFGALWRSLLVPGWGQAKLDRKLTGGLFVAWEGVTLGMTLKASQELGYLRSVNSGRAAVKKKELQDWLVLLVFNHVFSGLEAFISAHLYDFPEDLRLQVVPTPAGVGGRVAIPVRFR
jgi:hypothetical protein